MHLSPPMHRKVLQPKELIHLRATRDKDEKIYTPEEFEFLKAMDFYKRHYHRPNPDCKDVLTVIRALGYTKGVIQSQPEKVAVP